LSREPDGSDWGIAGNLLAEIVRKFGVVIKLDLFASAAHHVCDKFVSQFFTPGCFAVHALKLNWAEVADSGQKGVTWLFPPIKCASVVLSLLQQYRIKSLLCNLVQKGSLESIQLNRLKEHAWCNDIERDGNP
jgi:hypothetical protein